jgi:hypothetical protein
VTLTLKGLAVFANPTKMEAMQVLLLQIMPTSDQLDAIRKIAEPVAVPVLMWTYKRLKRKINEMLTENSNRIRDELMVHIDKRITDHEAKESAILSNIYAALKMSGDH